MRDLFREQIEKSNLSLSTKTMYLRLGKHYNSMFKERPFDKENIENFMHSSNTKNGQSRNHNVTRAFLKRYYTIYDKLHLIPHIPKPERKSRIITYYTPQEIGMLRDICADKKLKLIILLLYKVGFRISELCNLKRKNLDLINGKVRFIGKGNKEAEMELTNDIVEQLKEWCAGLNAEDKVFNKTGRVTVWRKLKQLEGMFKLVNPEFNKNIHPHGFRHSLATELLDRDVDITIIKEIMRHSNIETTSIYAHIKQPKVWAAYKQVMEGEKNVKDEYRRIIGEEVKVEEVRESDDSGNKEDEGLVEGEGLQSEELVLPDLYRLWF